MLFFRGFAGSGYDAFSSYPRTVCATSTVSDCPESGSHIPKSPDYCQCSSGTAWENRIRTRPQPPDSDVDDMAFARRIAAVVGAFQDPAHGSRRSMVPCAESNREVRRLLSSRFQCQLHRAEPVRSAPVLRYSPGRAVRLSWAYGAHSASRRAES